MTTQDENTDEVRSNPLRIAPPQSQEEPTDLRVNRDIVATRDNLYRPIRRLEDAKHTKGYDSCLPWLASTLSFGVSTWRLWLSSDEYSDLFTGGFLVATVVCFIVMLGFGIQAFKDRHKRRVTADSTLDDIEKSRY